MVWRMTKGHVGPDLRAGGEEMLTPLHQPVMSLLQASDGVQAHGVPSKRTKGEPVELYEWLDGTTSIPQT